MLCADDSSLGSCRGWWRRLLDQCDSSHGGRGCSTSATGQSQHLPGTYLIRTTQTVRVGKHAHAYAVSRRNHRQCLAAPDAMLRLGDLRVVALAAGNPLERRGQIHLLRYPQFEALRHMPRAIPDRRQERRIQAPQFLAIDVERGGNLPRRNEVRHDEYETRIARVTADRAEKLLRIC